MVLSNDLISQFVKVTNDNKNEKKEITVYGTIHNDGNKNYVVLDGSKYDGISYADNVNNPDVAHNARIPIDDKTTTSVKNGDRVTVLIKNHTAIVTGNLTNNAVGDITIDSDGNTILLSNMGNEVKELKKDLSERVKTKDLESVTANIKKAVIDELDADFLTVEQADIKYANIDFSNIGKASMEYFYANSGLIENVVVSEGTITGQLVGVTIKGDLIEANTLVADKLVILGEDGLYYKLNTNGVTTEAEQTEYNSLNGSIITAKSITATQISVDDLVAFDAKIGGFTISDTSIYSEVKDSEDNVTRGIYLDSDGQINVGDASNFIKYYQDDDGTYKLAISASSILYALDGKQYSIADLGKVGDYVHIGTYDGEPCIELGETDSDFKLVITNTRIMFKEGTETPAYINNQSLHITKAVIEEEIRQGDFVWKIRQNGNMGLMWKGET